MSIEATNPAMVVVYSSRFCGYCMLAKRLLSSKGIDFEERIVDGDPALRAQMVEHAGRTSVPQIFVGSHHVGGCDDLHALEQRGDLDALLADARVDAS